MGVAKYADFRTAISPGLRYISEALITHVGYIELARLIVSKHGESYVFLLIETPAPRVYITITAHQGVHTFGTAFPDSELKESDMIHTFGLDSTACVRQSIHNLVLRA